MLPRVAEFRRWLGETIWAQEAEEWAADNCRALAGAWNGRWFDRVLVPEGEPLGQSQLFLDAQPWAILAGVADAERRTVLLGEIKARLVDPSPIGPVAPDPLGLDRGLPPGSGMNGGVSLADAAPLVWAWALDDPATAWALLSRCRLAAHAESYPEQWAGIWGGPDGYDSHEAACPGLPWQSRLPLSQRGVLRSHRACPIASAHSSGSLLFALAHLAGLEADARGYRLQPRLPLACFGFEAARVGVRWEEGFIRGYIVPQGNDSVELRVVRPEHFAARPHVVVDGHTVAAQLSDDGRQVQFKAFLRGGMRTEWKVTAEPTRLE